MKIIYNPKDGGPITQWVFEGIVKDAHFPDGYELKDNKLDNGLRQYTDFEAESILETYEFLKELTIDEAKAIIERPAEPTFACDFPNCEFKAKAKIGLEGHKRKHKLSAEELKPVLDPNLIPVSGGKRMQTPTEIQKMNDPLANIEINNGTDQDGVDWYGDGVQVENRNMGIRQPGRGHFVG